MRCLLAPPDVIKLRFGYDSFTFHMSQVSAQGLPIRFFENEHIALDIDEPKDLERFLSYDFDDGESTRVARRCWPNSRCTSQSPRSGEPMKRLELIGLEGIGEVRTGDSVGQLICRRLFGSEDRAGRQRRVGGRAKNRFESRRAHDSGWTAFDLRARAASWRREFDKEPELVEVILGESRSVIRTGGRALIVETHHGLICANAGVDQSNVGLRQVALLPQDPDRSAREIRSEIAPAHRQESGGDYQRQLRSGLACGHRGRGHRGRRYEHRSKMSAAWTIATAIDSRRRWRRSRMNSPRRRNW